MYKQRERLSLPNPVPGVELPYTLRWVMIGLLNRGEWGATSLEFQNEGFMHPSNAIYRLRKLGAVIDTTYCSGVGANGMTYPRLARWVFRYWSPETCINSLNYDLNEAAQ